MPAALETALKAFNQREGVTTFMTCLAAFKALLHRYGGQTDLLVGSPIAGRSRPELEPLVGCFINTLVLRTDLFGDPTFRELLTRVRDAALAAYAHPDLPFELLIDELQVPRDRSRNPLFQAMFIDSSSFIQPLRLPGLTFTPMLVERYGAMLDLTFFLVQMAQGLGTGMEYSTELYDQGTITRMLRNLHTLLAGALRDPDQRLSELPLLSEAERQQMLVDWNATTAPFPATARLPQLLEAQVERSPEATALSCNGSSLSYRQLNARANQLAHFLRSQGVAPDSLVGLCVERSLDMVVGALGILKAGGAYLPLDPSYPPERLAFMLEDAGVSLVLTQQPLLAQVPLLAPPASPAPDGQPARQVLCLDRDWARVAAESEANPPPSGTAEHLAYLIYTSGSTGKPKGVQIPHRALVNFLWAMKEKPGLSPADTLAAVTTLSFDIAGLELWLPLLVGARVEVVSRAVAADGPALARLLEEGGVTVLQATPATWRLLVEAGWEGGSSFKMLCGGEALPRELADALLERGAELWNMYGPTETTIWSAASRVERGEGPVLIGEPIANTTFFVLDEQGQPVPIGMPGELHIGGEGVARGYLKREALTAEKFIADPFSERAGARLYRTGDLVRYLPDGYLEFLGRIDHQVKVRGFRIELGEVEGALNQLEWVRESVVVAREETPGDRRLVAYLTLTSEAVAAGGSEEEWLGEGRRWLEGKLPAYMVPSQYVVLEALPRTPNGKVDRHALPAPGESSLVARAPFVAPRTAEESTLAGIWADVLRLEQVGIHDDVFALGADSLLIFQITARANEAGIPITPRQLFAQRTIAGLAMTGANETNGNGASHAPAITRVARRTIKRSELAL
jgi:amino acid adenylation domain-containing protein